MQTIGDLSSTTMGGMGRVPTDQELSGGIIGQGLMSIIGVFFGGLPVASFSQNVGIVTVNKVINRAVFAFSALVLLIAGLVPKFAAVLTTIPQCVIGGATLSVFATITMTGIRMIVSDGEFTVRKSTVAGLSVALGTGITQVPGCLSGAGFPDWVSTVFGSTAVVAAAIMALKGGNIGGVNLVEQVKSLEAKLADRDAEEAVELALKAGKITPAQREWAKGYALKSLDDFRGFVEKAPQVVPMGTVGGSEPLALKNEELDEATLLVCKQLGISAEDVKKYGMKGE